jgi:tRNA-specific 2-thiouridylase
MESVLLDHFINPKNVGELAGADGIGEAGESGCGAVIRVFIKFDREVIKQASFMATGSSAAIAAGSLLTESIIGKTWRVAAALPTAHLVKALGYNLSRGKGSAARADGKAESSVKATSGNAGSSKSVSDKAGHDLVKGAAKNATIQNAAVFAIEGLHAAFEDSFRRGTFPTAKKIKPGSVLVAMSGGVDSSVACLLAHESGQEVTGVTMRLWSDPACENDAAPSCCSPQAIRDTRAICHSLGLPHLTVDFSKEFEREVVDYFVSEYTAGRTPNPCTRCNGRFRFPELISLADRLGVATVATGHYVRIVKAKEHRFISRGVDLAKDQSYMLWGIDERLLARLDFPLGELTKASTRLLARNAGLPVHDRSDSQEVCFIPDDDYRRFLRSQIKEWPGAGDIVDTSGKKLGRHTGYLDYTIGQRRGLGLSSPHPLYVLRIIPEENQIVVGSREELAVSKLVVANVNSFVAPDKLKTKRLQVQVRYNSGTAPVKLNQAKDDTWWLKLLEPVLGVAPGQSAVVYDGDMVVAGGIIEAAT